MEDVASASVLAGPSQPTCSRPPGSERRKRKSGTANIFQGVNLRQLRRLFQAAGDPDAEQRAQMVWGNHRAARQRNTRDAWSSQVRQREKCFYKIIIIYKIKPAFDFVNRNQHHCYIRVQNCKRISFD
uniref:Arginine vasopressin-induced protein 1 n=1 Tax=Cyprinus carpio TaxID=7962 RepID=A0A8C2FBB4_CYPCA